LKKPDFVSKEYEKLEEVLMRNAGRSMFVLDVEKYALF
jgi:hypothetical protein